MPSEEGRIHSRNYNEKMSKNDQKRKLNDENIEKNADIYDGDDDDRKIDQN